MSSMKRIVGLLDKVPMARSGDPITLLKSATDAFCVAPIMWNNLTNEARFQTPVKQFKYYLTSQSHLVELSRKFCPHFPVNLLAHHTVIYFCCSYWFWWLSFNPHLGHFNQLCHVWVVSFCFNSAVQIFKVVQIFILKFF